MTRDINYSNLQPHGIMFHHFHGEGHPRGQGSISQDDFAAMIEYLGPERILNADEWVEQARTKKLRESSLCITFDDNLRCQFDVAYPVLKNYGIKPFWFIYSSVLDGKIESLEVYRYFRTTQYPDVEDFYSDFFSTAENSAHAAIVTEALKTFQPGQYLKDFPFYTENDRKFRFIRDGVLGPAHYNEIMDSMVASSGLDPASLANQLWMNRANLLDLQRSGHMIGLHSHSHPTALAKLSASEQKKEYETNYSYLTDLLGNPPICASHPCNSYGKDTLEILEALKIQVAFRANMTMLHQPSLLEMPREDHSNVLKEMRLS